ncbi:MAG TPA: ATP-binding protein [Gemmatimonadaceae bacterium]|nr:ATP-binding protein [Gemmatimonadaceae bacterium]
MLSTDSLERQLLDALPVTIHVLDPDGRLTSVHQSATRFSSDTGGTPASSADSLRGTQLWDVSGLGFTRDQVEHAMHRLRNGRAPVVRWELTPAGDDRRVMLAQMTPLHDESRAVTGYVVSTTDAAPVARARDTAADAARALARVTDVEHACQEAAYQLRQTVRPDLVVIAMADDASSVMRVAYESGADTDHRALERRFASSWTTASEEDRVVTSRSESAIELTAPLKPISGAGGAITMVSDDLDSPERLMEAGRFLSALARDMSLAIERARFITRTGHKRRSEAISEVAAGVASELRNPIFGISSAAQLLRFRAREDPVMEKNVGRILREVERLSRIVPTLMELGRPIAMKTADADPDAVWDDVLATERGRLESRVIALKRTRPETPAVLSIDAELLAQAFRSILSNAVDAAPEASDIALHATTLPNGGWHCRLTNGGEPIAPEMLPRVFELFLSTKPGSTGVGLALAQRIVDEHHGSIAIESDRETGTTVTVTLPGPTRIATVP